MKHDHLVEAKLQVPLTGVLIHRSVGLRPHNIDRSTQSSATQPPSKMKTHLHIRKSKKGLPPLKLDLIIFLCQQQDLFFL